MHGLYSAEALAEQLRPDNFGRVRKPLRVTSAVEAGLTGTRVRRFSPFRDDPNVLPVVDYELSGKRLHRCHPSCLTARSIRTSSGQLWPVAG